MFNIFKPHNFRSSDEPYVMGVLICLKKPMSSLMATEAIISEELFGFQPATMSIQSDEVYSSEMALAQLRRKGDNASSVFWSAGQEASLTVCTQAIHDSAVCLFWELNKSELYSQAVNSTIIRFLKEPLFVSAFVYDYYDLFWQSASNESDYNVFGRKTHWLRFIKDEYDETVIDVSKNYGRRFMLSDTNVIAGSSIWMSPFFLEKFNAKEKIMQMESVEVLDNGIIKLDLYQVGAMPDRDIQKKFLTLLGLI